MGRHASLVQLMVENQNAGPRIGASRGRTLAKITFYSKWKECNQLLFRFLFFSNFHFSMGVGLGRKKPRVLILSLAYVSQIMSSPVTLSLRSSNPPNLRWF